VGVTNQRRPWEVGSSIGAERGLNASDRMPP
jgi:hypothetical protein